MPADRVVSCTGPSPDITRRDEPLVQSLLRLGLCRPDPMRMGFDVAPDTAVIARDGGISGRMFALGPMTRGTLWEITAVPQIRDQCRNVAALIARRCRQRAEEADQTAAE